MTSWLDPAVMCESTAAASYLAQAQTNSRPVSTALSRAISFSHSSRIPRFTLRSCRKHVRGKYGGSRPLTHLLLLPACGQRDTEPVQVLHGFPNGPNASGQVICLKAENTCWKHPRGLTDVHIPATNTHKGPACIPTTPFTQKHTHTQAERSPFFLYQRSV